ncbi:hypothetical protein SAMN06296386_105248 [Lachnospiraceae bacterium]|nr:hypothetical protein SAMN06296386_105248 [Lachnospiraceae bacterium]
MEYVDQLESVQLLINLLRIGFNLIFLVLTYIGLWKMFTKAGEEGWKCIIPFYNTIMIGKIAKREKMANVIVILQIVNIIVLTIFLFGIIIFAGIGMSGMFGYADTDLSFGTAIFLIIFGIITIMASLSLTAMSLYLDYYFIEAYNAPALFLLLILVMPWLAWLIIGFSSKYQYIYENNKMNGGYFGNSAPNGYGQNSYGQYGYSQNNNYSQNNYDQYGYPQNNNYGQSSYDRYGYPQNSAGQYGYNPGNNGVQNGYNQNSYNQNSYNQNSYNQSGYNQNGYGQNTYNQNGYNGNGYQNDGNANNDRFDGMR